MYPAKLVFVSFLYQREEGYMVSELRKLGFSPLQFKFDNQRPDLTKLDNLFGQLSAETSMFDDEVKNMEIQIKDKGLEDVFCKVKMLQDKLKAEPWNLSWSADWKSQCAKMNKCVHVWKL